MKILGSILKKLWNFVIFLFGGKYPYGKRISNVTSQKIQERWKSEVALALRSQNPTQLRQALITSDKLLDTALGELVEGENMSSKLKNAKDKFDWDLYDKIWKAHKVRNSLVHDLDYEPTYFILEEAINDLKAGLIEIGVSI